MLIYILIFISTRISQSLTNKFIAAVGVFLTIYIGFKNFWRPFCLIEIAISNREKGKALNTVYDKNFFWLWVRV